MGQRRDLSAWLQRHSGSKRKTDGGPFSLDKNIPGERKTYVFSNNKEYV